MSDSEGYMNVCGVGLKKVKYFPNGSARMPYKGDEELVCIVKLYKNRKIMVTGDFVFVFPDDRG